MVWPWEPGAGDPGGKGQSWGHLLWQCPWAGWRRSQAEELLPRPSVLARKCGSDLGWHKPVGCSLLCPASLPCAHRGADAGWAQPGDSNVPAPGPGRSAHPGAATAQCSEAASLVPWHRLRAAAAGRSGSAARPLQSLWFSPASLQEGSFHRGLTAPMLLLTHQDARQGLSFPCCARCALPSQWKREVGGRHGRARTVYAAMGQRISERA